MEEFGTSYTSPRLPLFLPPFLDELVYDFLF